MSEKIHLTALTAIVACLLTLSMGEADAQTAGSAADAALADERLQRPWPTQVAEGDARFRVYQPQFEKWEGDRIDGRAAVAILGPDGEADGFGMVWLSARTTTDRTAVDSAGTGQSGGTVTIGDITLSRAEFPTAEARSADYLGALRRQLAAKSWQVPLERLQADLQIERATRAASAQPLNNDPPQILYSDRPAVLVPVDGEPVLRALPGTGLERVINTRALMVRDDAAGRFYLYLTDRWLSAKTLAGPWTEAAGGRDGLDEVLRLAREDGDVDLLEDEDGAGPPAAVLVSTVPAELLQTDGTPDYAPIEGTRLLQVSNSPNRIFMDLRTQQHYALISGRWYRARSLRAPNWEYVPGSALPSDFAMIPEEHATSEVRAAVPGTPQAREAAIANEVPQIAAVTRSAAGLEIRYDGDAAFDPIPGTALYRAINAPIPVIRVADDSFYALDDGVWFVASSPYGPWAAATYVPPAVYAIPRSSPLHYVTYVRVYDATPDVVYVGYTPGYLGSYVSADHVVVYGSGWHYRPWIGSVWYASPVTWGFGFSIVHSWWYPWRPVVSVGWAAPHYRPHYRPWWGPWHHRKAHPHRHGANVTVINNVNVGRRGYLHTNVGNIYRRWDRTAVVTQRQSLRVPDRRAPLQADRSRGTLRPGTGWIENAAGRRQFIDGRADRARIEARNERREWQNRDGQNRDWRNRDDDRRNRAALPPVRRSDAAPARIDPGRGNGAGEAVRRAERPERNVAPPFQRRDDGRGQVAERRWNRERDRTELPRIQAPRRQQADAAPVREPRAPFVAGTAGESPRRQAGERATPRQLQPQAQPRPPRVQSPAEVRRAPAREVRPAPAQAAPSVAPPRPSAESGGFIRRSVERRQIQGASPPRQIQSAPVPRQIQGAPAPRQIQAAPRQMQRSEPRRQFSGDRAQARGGEGRVPRGGPAGMRIDR